MAVTLHYKSNFLRRILSGCHSDLPACVLVQISKSENCKPFVELYCSDGDGLSSALRWIDRELPQLSGYQQGPRQTEAERCPIDVNIWRAEKLKAEIESSLAASQRNIDFAEHMLIRSRKLSAFSRPSYSRR